MGRVQCSTRVCVCEAILAINPIGIVAKSLRCESYPEIKAASAAVPPREAPQERKSSAAEQLRRSAPLWPLEDGVPARGS